jgi:hypothetical protein
MTKTPLRQTKNSLPSAPEIQAAVHTLQERHARQRQSAYNTDEWFPSLRAIAKVANTTAYRVKQVLQLQQAKAPDDSESNKVDGVAKNMFDVGPERVA